MSPERQLGAQAGLKYPMCLRIALESARIVLRRGHPVYDRIARNLGSIEARQERRREEGAGPGNREDLRIVGVRLHDVTEAGSISVEATCDVGDREFGACDDRQRRAPSLKSLSTTGPPGHGRRSRTFFPTV